MNILKFSTMEDWQKKKIITIFGGVILVAVIFLVFAITSLTKDRKNEEYYWQSALAPDEEMQGKVDELSVNAIPVKTGTYIENIKEISLKGNYFRVVFQTWFSWEGDEDLNMKDNFRVYKGYMNKMEVMKDYHENGVNYQLLSCDVTVTKNFWTKRFPLESHQLKIYTESEYPLDKVILVADKENSNLNKNLSVSGYDVVRYDTAIQYMQYDGTHGDPELTDAVYTSEFLTAVEINRASWGLYVKCFIALLGTTTWVLITLYINTYHRVDPLGMLPAALFGTVTNIMVGANLLPDALEIGLLEYVNFWGIFIILIVALSVININRIRNKYEDREFAKSFGRLMLYTVLALVFIGHILIPTSAYLFS